MSKTQGCHGSMLVGSNNYYIRQLKMKVMLRRENVWDFIKTHIQLDYFLTMVLEPSILDKQ
jgi:hypothetical protein